MLTYGNKAIGILDPKPCISVSKLKTTDLFFYSDFKERLQGSIVTCIRDLEDGIGKVLGGTEVI